MNKVRVAIVVVLAVVVIYPALWIAARVGLLKDVEFGYFGEFNIAKHAIQGTRCAELIEYSGVNRDVVLEEFHFKVTTPSGRVVRLWFDASAMDVREVCYRPVGISVIHPAHTTAQRYRIGELSTLLTGDNAATIKLRDILCNIDQLEQVVRLSQGHADDSRGDDPYVWDYLRIEFPSEDNVREWTYTDIRDVDVSDWP